MPLRRDKGMDAPERRLGHRLDEGVDLGLGSKVNKAQVRVGGIAGCVAVALDVVGVLDP